MVRYDVRSGVKKIKTKTSLTISAITIGAAGLVMGVAIPAISHADTQGTNFDSFSLGSPNGQDGWVSTGSATNACGETQPYDHKVVNNSYGISSFGTKSLRISNAVATGCFGDQTFSKSTTNEAGEADALSGGMSGGTRQPHYESQFDLASTVPDAAQNGLLMSVSPDRGDGARMSYLRFEDHSSTDVYTADTADATHTQGSNYTDGIHVYFDDVTDPTHATNFDTFNESDVATLKRSIPHTIKFSMDFYPGPDNDVVRIYIDGNLVKTGTSWENYYRYDTESNPGLTQNDSRTVDSLLFRTGGASVPTVAGNGFLVDNFTETTGGIPANLPTDKDQCKGDGWKSFGNAFKNQGDCVSFVASKGKNQPTNPATQPNPSTHSVLGVVTLDNPTQNMTMNLYDNGLSANDTGYVTYSNPSAGLTYTVPPTCVNVVGKIAYFAYQIPSDAPVAANVWVVWKVVDGSPDKAGFSTAADMASANSMCEAGFTPTAYNAGTIVGDIVVQ